VAGGLLTLVALGTVKVISNGKDSHPVGGVEQSAPSNVWPSGSLEKATSGAGCFWCTETMFQRLKGVKSGTPLSLTFPGRSCESSAASVREGRSRKVSLARG
jgi:Peptide methionine sulfoxide reductase